MFDSSKFFIDRFVLLLTSVEDGSNVGTAKNPFRSVTFAPTHETIMVYYRNYARDHKLRHELSWGGQQKIIGVKA